MEADKIVEVERLSSEAAWDFFRKNVTSPEEIQKSAMSLVEECNGVPLALKMVARVSSSITLREWPNVLWRLKRSRVGRFSHGIEDRLLFTLRLAYDSMQDSTIIRRCFLPCLYWPRHCNIKKYELIECWMGLGLIKNFSNIDDAYFRGLKLVQNLKRVCLLEPGDNEDREVKMQGMVRDMALMLASLENQEKESKKRIIRTGEGLSRITEEEAQSWREAKHVSLMDNEIETLPSKANCRMLRTLILGMNGRLKDIPSSFLAAMSALSYLDLSRTGVKELPKEIGDMSMMEYINLSRTPISALPGEVGKLLKLKYLHLNRTRHLKTIAPGVISKLSMLQLLDMYRSGYACWHTEVNGSLKELDQLAEVLKVLGITVDAVSVLRELSSLKKLCASLRWLSVSRLEGLQMLSLPPILLWSLRYFSVEGCKSLEWLIMTVGDCKLEENPMDGGRAVWRSPSTVLEILHLRCLPNLKKITWTEASTPKLFPELRRLKISSCNRLKNVSWVLQLPSLEELTLVDCKEMEKVIDPTEDSNSKGVVGKGGGANATFPNLKILVLKYLPKLICISPFPLTYPSLVSMNVFNCSQLKELPSAEEAPLAIKRIYSDGSSMFNFQ